MRKSVCLDYMSFKMVARGCVFAFGALEARYIYKALRTQDEGTK